MLTDRSGAAYYDDFHCVILIFKRLDWGRQSFFRTFAATFSKNSIIAGTVSNMEHISDTFWEATYRKNIAKMIGVCWRYTQDRQTAEDLAHDAFIIAISKAYDFENRGPFEAWLRRIVVNVALQYVRKQKNFPKTNQIAGPFEPVIDIPDDEDVIENATFSETQLLSAIAQLPEHHRLVFNLYVIDNLTHSEIADQLDISEGTSKSHLARARKKIKEILFDSVKNKRQKAMLWLIIPFWNFDQIFFRTLKNLSIDLKNKHQIDFMRIPKTDIHLFKFGTASVNIYSKVAISVGSAALIFSGIVIFNVDSPEHFDTKESIFFEAPDSTQRTIHINLITPKTATIPKNPIIVEKTKTEKPMKNLSTLGGLLIAGLTLDSTTIMKDLSSRIKSHEVAAYHNEEAASDSGTFYAPKLLYSETHNLYFLGDNVKVDFASNKFSGSGKFAVMGEVYYLVVEHVPIKMNDAIKLSNKKYNIVQLNKADGEKKYGQNGKQGVVEITLAE
ncbi:RNA polymerase sigma factor [Dyadobacter luticola]|uniref:RNA polymerase sigma factor n=1 Tax=Dyadobacter luticola TaxID=1979387 RepID=A0A5R9L2W7_9BACT|nr:RNA polymerase sigma factor [Dyadobacter luticola]TLV02906.1 RNA polymerase sigma factor [Dyadobacter luticola]